MLKKKERGGNLFLSRNCLLFSAVDSLACQG
jgi:hypothetical protein